MSDSCSSRRPGRMPGPPGRPGLMSDPGVARPASTDPPLLAIFDHDGVLVDSLDLHQRAWVEMGRRGGLPITAEFVKETFGMTNPAMFRRLLGDALTEAEARGHSETK